MPLLVPALLLLFQPESSNLRQLFESRFLKQRTAQTARDLGLYLARHNDPKAARVALTEALRLSGASSDALELALVSPGSEAKGLLIQAAQDPRNAARALNLLGHYYDSSGNRPAAAAAYRRALALKTDADTLEALAHDAEPEESIALLRRALALNRSRLGIRHPQTATTQANLAAMLLNAGQNDAAVAAAREALSIFEETLGREHLRTAAAAAILAEASKPR